MQKRVDNMTREEMLACLTDRPCDVCKFHTENGCKRWKCVFEEEPDDAENKGEWRPIYQGDEIIDYRCNKCDFGSTFGRGKYRFNFCPNCGADMRGE